MSKVDGSMCAQAAEIGWNKGWWVQVVECRRRMMMVREQVWEEFEEFKKVVEERRAALALLAVNKRLALN